MKKIYGDIIKGIDIKQQTLNDNMELYSKNDIISDRTLNRPLLQLENEFEKHRTEAAAVLRNFTNGEGIIKGYYENLNISKLKAGKLIKNNKMFLRIPLGVFNYKFNNDYKIYFNYPKVEIFERQLADHFNIDLHDQDGSLFVDCKTVDGETKYTVNISNTVYDYGETETSATYISNSVETIKLPITDYYHDIFEIISGMKTKYESFLTKRDDLFSLEELIELKIDWAGSDEYIVFFNPYNSITESYIDFSSAIDYTNLPSDFDSAVASLGNDFTPEELNSYVLQNSIIEKEENDVKFIFFNDKFYILKNEQLYNLNEKILDYYEDISWSYSEKFGLIKKSIFNNLTNTNFVKLFGVDIYIELEDNKISSATLSNKTCFLELLDLSNLLVLNDTTTFKGTVKGNFEVDNTADTKTEPKPTTVKGLDSVNKLSLYDFNNQIGYNSEEAPDIFSNTSKTSLNYYNNIGVLLKAVQELSKIKGDVSSPISRWLRFDPANKKGVIIKANTLIKVGENIFLPAEDVSYDLSEYITQAGKDYFIYLNYIDGDWSLSATLTKTTDTSNSRYIGRVHTLCVSVPANTTMIIAITRSSATAGNNYLVKPYKQDTDADFYEFYNKTVISIQAGAKASGVVYGPFYDIATVNHPLAGFAAGDILPESVWCLTWKPDTLFEDAMVYDAGMNIAVDVYLQSGTGINTRSAYGATHTVSRPQICHSDDMMQVGKRLLSDDEFTSIALGSNEQTAIQGAKDWTTVGGHVDTAGRRMISAIGCEECCGYLWQWLRDVAGLGSGIGWTNIDNVNGHNVGNTGWLTEDGQNKFGQMYYCITAVLAGADWGHGGSCGSRSRSGCSARSHVNAGIGGRGSSLIKINFG